MLETADSVASTFIDAADHEIVVSRLFDAPRELVFEVWTDVEHKSQWWGPNGFTTTTQEYDFRPGGVWQHTMHGPDGADYPGKTIFTEIVRPEFISYKHGGGKLDGRDISFQGTVTFEAEGDKTFVTLRMVFPTAEERDFCLHEHKADEGGEQTLARLADYLAKPPAAAGYTLHISRMFDAPRDLVYKAFTDPAMLAEWMGPRGFRAMDIEYDVRAGGKWRARLHRTSSDVGCDAGDATDLWMGGTYFEIAPPERLVYTFAWENRIDSPAQETTCTVTFRELEGKTVMDFKQGLFDSAEDRDGHNVGWSSSFDRFAQFLLAPAALKTSTYDLVIEREFDAPRDLVWKIWTDPALAAEWAGPRGFTATHCEFDARVGGKWRLCLHSDGFDQGDGVLREQNLWQGGTFREIVPPERIVYTFAWDNPADVGLNLAHHETLITVRFSEHAGKTWMVFCQEFFLSAGERDGHQKGWSSAFDKLVELVQAQARTV
jgi:uncharacterized protein YndB with AHSA1/START domain